MPEIAQATVNDLLYALRDRTDADRKVIEEIAGLRNDLAAHWRLAGPDSCSSTLAFCWPPNLNCNRTTCTRPDGGVYSYPSP